MLEVAIAYFVALTAVGCALLLGVFAAILVRSRAGIRSRLVLILFGMLLMGVAGLEKMGSAVRPWSLGSAAQHFDDIMFWVFWLTGIFFVFAGWMLWLLNHRDPSNVAMRDDVKRVNLGPELLQRR